MSHRRTASGISNLSLFHNASGTVYVEGGDSLTSTEIKTGKYNVRSYDILFWELVFSLFRPDRKYHFKALGSKTTLSSIMSGIEEGTIRRTVVCADRDFDHINGRKSKSSEVLYTHGYSWENDVWSANVVESIFLMLCPVASGQLDVGPLIRRSLEILEASLYWPVVADFLCALMDATVIPRDSLACVIHDSVKLPQLDRVLLRSRVRAARSRRPKGCKLKGVQKPNVSRDCCGHLFGHLCYLVLIYYLRTSECSISLNKDVANALAIKSFSERLEDTPDLLDHYRAQFAGVTI